VASPWWLRSPVAEVGDFRRFANARQLMAYLGRVPSEHSSGATSPETKPRSCGNQPAHESLFNRRLRALSPTVRTFELTSSAAAETNNCVRTLESEHESRMRKKSRH
jgi:hypothetical protein